MSRIEPPPMTFDIWPLTPLQEGLLFHAQYDGDAPDVYVSQTELALSGRLDTTALRASMETLVQRHATLRAAFAHEGLQRPVQIVADAVSVPWREIDLSHLDGAERDRRVAEVLDLDRATRFDMATPPLLRCTLMHLGRDESRLLLTRHHILFDGWSLPLLLDELWTLYAQGGQADGLPPVVPYYTYLTWRAAQDEEAARSAWLRALDGLEAGTRLTDSARGAPGSAPEELTYDLPADVTAAVVAQARRQRWTLNTILQLAWAVVLGRATRSDDVVFGMTVAGRPADLPGIETMIGFFINTVPVRVRWQPGHSLAETLTRLQSEQADLLLHQHTSLREIQQLSGLGDFFDTLLVVETFPMSRGTRGRPSDALRVTKLATYATTHYPITLIVVPGTQIQMRFGYRSDLITRERVESLARQMASVLTAVGRAPEQRLADASLLTTAERQQVLTTWSSTSHSVPEVTLPALFEAQAARVPDAIAAVCDDNSVSYFALNRAADHVAHRLREQGVGPEVLVGVCMRRTIALAPVILGVLKAGGAVLPLDREDPSARIRAIISRTQPRVIVVDETMREHAPSWSDVQVLFVDDDCAQPADDGQRAAFSGLQPGNLLYVVHTSGSTGRPKGVALEHRALANLIAWNMNALPADGPILQFASITFDVAFYEFFTAWGSGRRVVIASDSMRRDPFELRQQIDKHRVATAILPKTVLQRLAKDSTDCPAATSLKDVVTTGEQLVVTVDIRSFFDELGGCRLHNHYGPSETHVVTASTLPHSTAQWETLPAIGQPIWNTAAYVCDRHLNPTPVGEIGELYIGGANLARGYFDQPGLTATRFVANPYGMAGGRMYRTGDLARWRRDGTLEFLGRADAQIKIRGFRVEPSEVEAALREEPGVGDAVVVARGEDEGKQLVGYVVPAAGAAVEGTTLRHGLASRLPAHLIPAAVVVLERWPLTPNRKIDRAALPEPAVAVLSETYRAPRTPLEAQLCTLMAEVLGVAQVGLDDDFFALGGHSLTAMALASRVRATLGVELPVRSIFEAPTVARLAASVGAAGPARPVLGRMERPEVLPLSHSQQRLWFLNQLDEGGATYNVPLAMRIEGALDRAALKAAFADVLTRHESLRTIFPEVNGTPQQLIMPADVVDVPLPIIESSEAELLDMLRHASSASFDLRRDLPIRTSLYALGRDVHVCLIVLHHIASDGWSLGPLLRDLAQAYGARREGHEPTWAPLPVQYADYALWQRAFLGSESDERSVLAEQLRYWQAALANLPAQILATDYPRPAAVQTPAAHIALDIPADVHAGLLQQARASEASVAMAVNAAVAAVLTRAGAGVDIPIGTSIAGRIDALMEPLVGFFINTLVMRIATAGNPTLRDLVMRVRDTALAAYTHADVPFERVVEQLQPERMLGRSPLFQVAATVDDLPPPRLRLPDLKVSAEPIDLALAKVDLAVTLTERRTADGQPAGMTGRLTYRPDLLRRARVESLARQVRQVLTALARTPDQRLAAVELLDPAEREQLLVTWSGTSGAGPRRTLPALFEAQAARTPDAIALVDGRQQVSYQALNTRANRLAHQLIALGVGPERVVAVALDRSVDFVVALCGILKAGGVYLPLDPAAPAERLAQVICDAAPVVVVSGDRPPCVLPAGTGHSSIASIERSEGPAHDPTDADRHRPLRLNHPSYVIYTSGSSGTPKGVVVDHAAIANYVQVMCERVQFGEQSTFAVVQSMAFDFVATALYGALLNGHRLVIVPEAVSLDSAALANVFAQAQIDCLKITPSHLAALLAGDAGVNVGRLRCLILGGEPCQRSWLESVQAAAPQCSIFNHYGPTETTVGVAMYRLRETVPDQVRVPLGTPLANSSLHVLDSCLQPVPVGIEGELYISGAGLARGYLNRAGLTGERFVANAYGPAGTRMYRTGDIVRWQRDGTLEFVGRADAQVKIRGFRVEPAEVEAMLRSEADVADAVVVARGEGDQTQLVGYAVPAAGAVVDGEVVRQRIAARMPAYMVPAVVLVLERWSLTPHGKLNRAALPAADGAAALRTYRPPRTPAEKTLCALMAEVLGVPQVGLDDNFFTSGGDSIMSIQLVSRARKAGLQLTPRDVFQRPTVEALAAVAHLEAPKPAPPDTAIGLVPLTPVVRRLQERAHNGGNPSSPIPSWVDGYHQSVLLEVPSGLCVDDLTRALDVILAHHDSLRLRLHTDAGGWQLEVPPASTSTSARHVRRVDCAALSDSQLAQQRRVEGAAAVARLKASAGELVQLVWFDRGAETPGELLIVVHHLAIDAVSWRILLADLRAACESLHDGRTPDLAPKGTSYRRWAERLNDDVQRTAEQELPYWRHLLRSMDRLVEQRLDPGRDLVETCGQLHLVLPSEVTQPLLGDVPAMFYAGIDDVLLTGLVIAVAQWRGDAARRSDAVAIEIESHGRKELHADVDLSRTVGWCTAVYPVRLGPDQLDIAQAAKGGPALGRTLKVVKEQLRQMPSGGLGYGLLRYVNAATRVELGQYDTPQLGFNYLGRFGATYSRRAWEPFPSPALPPPAGMPLTYPIAVNARTLETPTGPQLHAHWSWAPALIDSQAARRIAELWFEVLTTLSNQAAVPGIGGRTPSDLPLVALSQRDLEEIEARYDHARPRQS